LVVELELGNAFLALTRFCTQIGEKKCYQFICVIF